MRQDNDWFPSTDDLKSLFSLEHPDTGGMGWGPTRRKKLGYFTPDEYYRATVRNVVVPGVSWLDVGCGRHVFPNNPSLARNLASRCDVLVGVDPSDNIDENEFVHHRFKGQIEDFESETKFDLITLRMVAEHITDPDATVAAMSKLMAPNGKVVVFTVNKFAPLSILAYLLPFKLHHRIKKLVWRDEEQDTFPVYYRMNTRSALWSSFDRFGFMEVYFAYLDDCRTFARFRFLNFCELATWRVFKSLRLTYPEHCLLGIYEFQTVR